MARKKRSTTLHLPGIRSGLSVRDAQSAGGQPFALVASPDTGDHTVVLAVWPGTSPDLDLWCHSWLQSVELVSNSPDITAVTAVWDRNGDHEVARLGVTFRAATKQHRDLDEHAVEIGRRLPNLLGSLAQSGLVSDPLPEERIAAWISDAYTGHLAADENIPTWPGCGPITPHETRDWFSHDGYVSASWVHQPADTVTPEVHAMLTQTNAARARVAITYRPTNEEGTMLERFLVSTTLTDFDAEPSTTAIRSEHLPLGARLAARRGFDRNAELFAASLGVGVLLPEHGTVAEHPSRPYHRTEEAA
ncbi:SCO6880 family protein [Tsukamurella columbiensis]|uniref:Uncharacterized protein n=1 Tax=Tsukamurella columbiensis TaxID=128509 RepID=A0ABX1LK65_9ACTN|nr:SCO6880 family protein [Tsukamurella columbiensis]NMD57990.1 hypothetical protein [Tsukamurella columbiensis]